MVRCLTRKVLAFMQWIDPKYKVLHIFRSGCGTEFDPSLVEKFDPCPWWPDSMGWKKHAMGHTVVVGRRCARILQVPLVFPLSIGKYVKAGPKKWLSTLTVTNVCIYILHACGVPISHLTHIPKVNALHRQFQTNGRASLPTSARRFGTPRIHTFFSLIHFDTQDKVMLMHGSTTIFLCLHDCTNHRYIPSNHNNTFSIIYRIML